MFVTATQVIDDGYFKSALLQKVNRVRSDVARPAGYQNSCHRLS